MKTNKNRKKSKKVLFIVGLAILSIAIITTYGAVAYKKDFWPFNIQAQQDSKDDNSINYEPPTDQEVKDSQDGKKNIPDDNDTDNSNNNTGNLKSIEVGVAFADVIDGNIEVRAFTPSVVESDGTCTATLTKGSATVSAKSQAFIDSTTSQCQPIKIALSEFAQSGSWNLFVSYISAKSQGKSEIIEVQIP